MTEVVEVINAPRNRCVRCGSGVDKGLVCKEGKKCGGPSARLLHHVNKEW